MDAIFLYVMNAYGAPMAIAVSLNILFILVLIWMGKVFARTLFAEIAAIKNLLQSETQALRGKYDNHNDRIVRLETIEEGRRVGRQ